MTLRSRIDHLVVAAATLDEGIAWCRETFGLEPSSGGEHTLMSTHNRVFRIDSPKFPQAYLEVIAINPKAPDPGSTRWFDLDDARLRDAIASGPRLVHFVAGTHDAAAAAQALRKQQIDRGPLLAAERQTPGGLLRWKISVRDDGRRLFDGVLPTLIEWGGAHPCDALPASGIELLSLRATHPDAQVLQQAYDAIGLGEAQVQAGPANLVAELRSPKGIVRLESKGT